MQKDRQIPDGVRNGIELPIIRVNFKDYDLEQMSRSDLLTLKVQIDSEKDTIDYQLGEASVNRKTTGEYADPRWYNKAKFAGKIKAQQSQAIQAYLNKNGNDKTPSLYIGSFFIDAAKEMLTAEAFELVMQKAKVLRDDEAIRQMAIKIPIDERN